MCMEETDLNRIENGKVSFNASILPTGNVHPLALGGYKSPHCLSAQADPAQLLVSLMPAIREAAVFCLYAQKGRANVYEVDDLSQQTALHLIENVYARLLSYDPARSAPRAWLRSVVHNVLVDHLRRAPHKTDMAMKGRRDHVCSPEDILLRTEEEKLLKAAWESLGKADQEFVRELREHACKMSAMSDDLGVSRREIYQRKRRIVTKLRGCLAARGECRKKSLLNLASPAYLFSE